MSESGRQFAEIWDELHDPLKREEKRIKENRERYAKEQKEDTGL